MAVTEDLSIKIDVDTSALDEVSNAFQDLEKSAEDISSSIGDGFSQAADQASSAFESLDFSSMGSNIGGALQQGFSAGVDGVKNLANGAVNSVKGIFGALTSLPGLVGLGLGGLAIKDIIGASAEAEAQTARFNQTLNNTAAELAATQKGITNYDASQKKAIESSAEFVAIQKQFQSEANKTASAARRLGFDDEAAQVGFSKLVQATKDATLSQRGVAVAFDLARSKGIDFQTAILLTQRALTGQSGALKRYGINLEKGATGIQALTALENKFGGAAQGATKTFAVQQQIFSEAVTNIKEVLGKGFISVLTPLLSSFSDTLNNLLEGNTFEKIGEQIGGFATSAINFLKPIGEAIVNLFQGVFQGISPFFQQIIANIQAIFSGFSTGGINFQAIGAAIGTVVGNLVIFFTNLVLAVKQFLAAIPPEIITELKVAFDNLVLTLASLFGGTGQNTTAIQTLALIIAAFIETVIFLTTKTFELVNAFIQLSIAIGQSLATAYSTAVNFVGGIINLFSGLVTAAFNFGVNLINSIVNGIKSVGASIGNTIKGLFNFNIGGLVSPQAVRAASGGQISGAGSGTSDSILARLSNGEFVVNANATKAFLPLLHSINSFGNTMRGSRNGFAGGGMVSSVGGMVINLNNPNVTSTQDARVLANVIGKQLSANLRSRGTTI